MSLEVELANIVAAYSTVQNQAQKEELTLRAMLDKVIDVESTLIERVRRLEDLGAEVSNKKDSMKIRDNPISEAKKKVLRSRQRLEAIVKNTKTELSKLKSQEHAIIGTKDSHDALKGVGE